jgi:hypothetical protein
LTLLLFTNLHGYLHVQHPADKPTSISLHKQNVTTHPKQITLELFRQ